MKLAVVLGTVRENRLTERVAKWVAGEASQREGVEVTLIDLKDYPMPFFDEPMSPRYNPDRHINEVAQKWLAQLLAAEAFVYVTPEYNHSIPGVLKNALDYVTWEMVKKPATVVSHGTVGGARATMHLKEILSESRAAVIPVQVAVQNVAQLFDESGNLDKAASESPRNPQAALKNMLDELHWYSDALAAARQRDAAGR